MSNYNKHHFKACFCWTRVFKQREDEIPEDIKQIFKSYSVDGTMSRDNLISFLEKEQKEVNVTMKVEKIFSHKHLNIVHRRGLNLEAFFKYLLSDQNFAHHSEVHQNMDAPLAHYFIYTGHNSYLTGNQLCSDASAEPIKKALKKGVRVIELDLWPNSCNDDIIVKHGWTLTTPVKLSKCLKAIKDVALSVSEYPVILTFEDHLHPYPQLQESVAQMVKSTFGSMLFVPKSEMDVFPSPNYLKNKDYKFLISTKPPPKDDIQSGNVSSRKGHSRNEFDNDTQGQVRTEEEADQDEGDDLLKYKNIIAIHAMKHKGGMVNFWSHENSDHKVGRLSMSELALEKSVAVDEHSHQLIRFTQRNMLRVYPKGSRVYSSNYNPLIAWMRGAQMVAFNMQGYDEHLWMMQGFFRANGGCGYVKKPDFLLSADGACDEVFNSMTLQVKKTLKVKLYMGEGWHAEFHFRHFDYCSPPDFYARVGIAGVHADTTEMFKTETIDDQWVPIWNKEFKFCICVPELALLRIDVKDYDPHGKNEFAGQTCLPISELKNGIRCVPLYDHRGNMYKSVKLLMHFEFDSSSSCNL